MRCNAVEPCQVSSQQPIGRIGGRGIVTSGPVSSPAPHLFPSLFLSPRLSRFLYYSLSPVQADNAITHGAAAFGGSVCRCPGRLPLVQQQ
jgi:hypothetical protein